MAVYRKKVKQNCKSCGVEFEANDSDVKRGWGKTCSKVCAAKYREWHHQVFKKLSGKWGKS
jgi:hypothetical protein